jgi:hypothetical protein
MRFMIPMVLWSFVAACGVDPPRELDTHETKYAQAFLPDGCSMAGDDGLAQHASCVQLLPFVE